MHEQAGLGNKVIHRQPTYTEAQIGRVTSVNDYKKYGRVDVIFLDYGQPFPVWVNGDVDREPVSGDLILVGYLQGRPDTPYMLGFIRNESWTSNFIRVDKDRIIVQYPTKEPDIKGQHLLDDPTYKKTRVYVELLKDELKMHFPVEGYNPAWLKITPEGIEGWHPVGTFTMHARQDMPSPLPYTVSI